MKEQKDVIETGTGTNHEDPQILIGSSLVMRRLRATLKKVASNDCTVLLYGETGSGKEAAAKFIHSQYEGNGPLVVIDCASLTENLAEAELFGNAKGAFTGAVADRVGLFQGAEGGIAFFDEVGEIPLQLQPKFLRLMEEKTIRQLGTSRFVKVGTKIVAATNKNLAVEVEAKRFRQDLYARLDVVTVRMPSLAEHREDIPELVKYFLSQFIGVGISEEALNFLVRYSWPNNVRQLQGAISRAATFCNPSNGVSTLEKSDFDFLIESQAQAEAFFSSIKTELSLAEFERKYLRYLGETRRLKRNRMAKVLGVNRKTVLDKLKSYGLQDLIRGYKEEGEDDEEGEDEEIFVLSNSFQDCVRAATEKVEKDLLNDLFYNQRMSKKEICRITGWAYKTLSKKFKGYGINPVSPDDENENIQIILSEAVSISVAMEKLQCKTRSELLALCKSHGCLEMLNRFFQE